MRCLAVLVCLVVGAASAAVKSSYFRADFDEQDWEAQWVHSSSTKYDGKFVTDTPEGWTNKGLKIPEKNKHYGIAALLPRPADAAQGLVVQYEVRHAGGRTCGGSYLKLITHKPGWQAKDLVDTTPYSIMFGPDMCGGTKKVHLILRHPNPLNGSVEERHLVDAPSPITDSDTHVYTLRLTPPTKFEVLIDGAVKASGDLRATQPASFAPPFQPPTTVPDPSDVKPSDWVDDEMMPEPAASKPGDWDERRTIPDPAAKMPAGWQPDLPAMIPDPKAVKPADWDDEEDGQWQAAEIPNPACKAGCGEWKAPEITNPGYKGPWIAPMIKNPAYKGVWEARRIPNPDYWEDSDPLAKVGQIGALAIEVWTIDSDVYFDNLVISPDDQVPAIMRGETQKRQDREAAIRKAAQVKADAEKERQQRAKNKPKVTGLARAIIDAFKKPPLKVFRPYVRPLLRQLRRTPGIAGPLMLVSLGALITAVLLLALKRPSPKVDALGFKKKHDVAEPDDDEDEDVPVLEELQPTAAAAGGGGQQQGAVREVAGGSAGGKSDGGSDEFELVDRVAGKSASGAAQQVDTAPVTEIAADDDDDDDEEEEQVAVGTRRRNRKA